MQSTLQEHYRISVVPELMRRFGHANLLALPRLSKIIVNVGINVNAQKDPKFIETVRQTLTRITGQHPVERLAKKSVSSFKIRGGQLVGMMVTLRGRRMWDFFEKLAAIVFPRTRDFWGLSPTLVDQHGNCSIGFKEHLAFPEIRSDEVERVHGLEVTIVLASTSREQALVLYQLLGLPFKHE